MRLGRNESNGNNQALKNKGFQNNPRAFEPPTVEKVKKSNIKQGVARFRMRVLKSPSEYFFLRNCAIESTSISSVYIVCVPECFDIRLSFCRRRLSRT